MSLYYKLWQFYDNKFTFKITYKYSEFCKKKNKQIKYIFDDIIIIDLINDYPNYKYIENLNSVDNKNTYFYAVKKVKSNEKNIKINIGDIMKLKSSKNITTLSKEIYIYDTVFKLTNQCYYDRYDYLINKDTCNGKLYKQIYYHIIHFFKSNKTKKIWESVV